MAEQIGFPFKNPREVGLWNDSGTPKGMGFFGELDRPDGQKSTELSFTFDHNNQKIMAPLLVPTLYKDEVDSLLQDGLPTNIHYQKAIDHALQRIKQNKSPFASPEEQWNVPKSRTEEIVDFYRSTFPNWKKY